MATRWFTGLLAPMLLARKPLLSYQQSRTLKTRLKKSYLDICHYSKMSYATSQNVMPFVSELRATGHGEVWDHTDEKKLQQFGWRCTNTESSYDTKTLIGNWSEQRFDINRISKPKPIPSRYNHYFETTYGLGYHTVDTGKVPEALKHLEAREPTAFPGHQPELDPPNLKKQYNSFLTTSRAAFGDPTTQK